MRKVLALIFSLWSGLACANVPCALPFNLQNGTTADASQVMANYNAILNCLANAAASGQNSDITALLGLLTPISPTGGGSSHFIAGTSTGTNTIAVTVIPNTFVTPQQGWQVSFTVGGTNTGPSTLAVNGGSPVNLARPTTVGATGFIGGEFIVSNRVTVEFDGTQWQWLTPPIQVGRVTDHGTPAACPQGMLPASFQAVSRTTYAALFAVLGTTWGAGDGSTTFNLPDLRGRATYGLDQGLRITAAGGNFDGTIIGNAGGLQNSNGVGAHTHVATVTDPGHTHLENANTVAGGSSGVQQVATNGVNTATVTATASATTGVTVANASSGATYTVLGPAAIVLKCIQP